MPLGLNWPLSLHFIDWLWAGLLFVAHLATVARALTRANRTPASRVAWVATIMLLPIVGVLAYLLLGETSIGRGRFERLRRASSALRVPPQAPVLAPDRDAPLMDLARSINGFGAVGGNRITLHLMNALRRLGKKRGIATQCVGGGIGGALLIETV